MEKTINIENLKKDIKCLKVVVEKIFTYGDVDDKYDGADLFTHNISCPYHHTIENYSENKKSPAARFYYDDERDIQIVHCFKSGRNYSVYDYLVHVMQVDPYEYLLQYGNKEEIGIIYKAILDGEVAVNSDNLERKKNYIDEVFNRVNFSTVDYIEELYAPKGDR